MSGKFATTKEVMAYLAVQLANMLAAAFVITPMLVRLRENAVQLGMACDRTHTAFNQQYFSGQGEPNTACRNLSGANAFVHNFNSIMAAENVARIVIGMILFFWVRRLLEPRAVAQTVTGAALQPAMAYGGAGIEGAPPSPRETPASGQGQDGTMLGIVSLVLGLLGFVPSLGVIAAIGGLITGSMGRAQAKRAGNGTGALLALLGIILSSLTLVFSILALIVAGGMVAGLGGMLSH